MSQQKQSGFTDIVPYPQGMLKFILRAPMAFHQLGLGWMMRSVRLMALTTRGRKSQKPRHVILEYRRHGSKLYAISGWGAKPHWVQNLVADPAVTVQIGQQDLAANATIVEDSAEALRALYMFQRTGPVYEAIIANMSNADSDSLDLRRLKLVAGEFTVIRFDLTNNPPPMIGIHPPVPGFQFILAGVLASLVGWMIWALRDDTSADVAPQEDE
ncbi:MAG: nitroreductase family deazaflavin-dependent oxidoreductase [Chloroflexota bacterium]